jgi:hypothetical protein
MIQSHNLNPNNSTIMTRQDQSLPINDLSHITPPANHNASTNQFHLHSSFQSLLARFAQESSTAFNVADNIITLLPNIHIPSGANVDLPIITSQLGTEIHKANLLPNQAFTFNSRPTFNDQSDNNHVQTKNSPGPIPKPFNTRLLTETAHDPKST